MQGVEKFVDVFNSARHAIREGKQTPVFIFISCVWCVQVATVYFIPWVSKSVQGMENPEEIWSVDPFGELGVEE